MNQEQNSITLDQFRSVIFKSNISFQNKSELGKFLSQADLLKDMGKRLFAYLISFKILPFDSFDWAEALFNLYNQYRNWLEIHIKNSMNKPLKLNPEMKRVLKADLEKACRWFEMIAEDMNITTQTEDTVRRISRVIVIKFFENPSYEYHQGHDRYLFVSYLLSLKACFQFSLDPSLAEALTFFLFEKWNQLSNIQGYLKEIEHVQANFKKLDQMVLKFCPEIGSLIAQNGHSSFHFALSWHFLFFADEHPLHNLLLLWDSIILHQDQLSKYLFYLSVAHVKQVPIASQEIPMVEKIQKYHSYDIFLILSDVNRIMLMEKSPTKRIGMVVATCLMIALFLYFLK
jgi:hypothetical protein